MPWEHVSLDVGVRVFPAAPARIVALVEEAAFSVCHKADLRVYTLEKKGNNCFLVSWMVGSLSRTALLVSNVKIDKSSMHI